MKNIFSFKKLSFKPLVCVAIVSFQLFNSSSFAQFSGGNGTVNNPYIITTAAELAQLATYVNAGDTAYNNKQYKLANNINLSAYGAGFNNGKGWTPIGQYDVIYMVNNRPFKGIFNGDSNTITGLYINDSSLFCAGLFGSTKGASIHSLTLDSVNIKAGAYVGSIVGFDSASAILSCSSSGTIKAGGYVGGLLGYCPISFAFAALLDCHSSCNITGLNYVGGLAGAVGNLYKITNCYSTGNISGNDFVGGIVGMLTTNSSVMQCYSTGNVVGNSNVSGIAGFVVGSIVSNNYSIGNITANNYSGGIAGKAIDGGCTKVIITNNAALNQSINGEILCNRIIGDSIERRVGVTIEVNNLAYESILTYTGDVLWQNKGADNLDGEDISKETINADGTLGGRFTDAVWTTQNGKLPGLFGKPVEMPEHLQKAGQGTTGIAERDNSDIRVYPNPTTGELTIDNGQLTIDNVEVYDISGKLVQTYRFNSSTKVNLDVSTLAKGAYSLSIYSEGQKTTKKFVKE